MKQKIKLIWDFRGPDALETAKHHAMHLKEFTVMENLRFFEVSTSRYSDYHSIAYMVIDENDLDVFKDALHPHRAEITA